MGLYGIIQTAIFIMLLFVSYSHKNQYRPCKIILVLTCLLSLCYAIPLLKIIKLNNSGAWLFACGILICIVMGLISLLKTNRITRTIELLLGCASQFLLANGYGGLLTNRSVPETDSIFKYIIGIGLVLIFWIFITKVRKASNGILINNIAFIYCIASIFALSMGIKLVAAMDNLCIITLGAVILHFYLIVSYISIEIGEGRSLRVSIISFIAYTSSMLGILMVNMLSYG